MPIRVGIVGSGFGGTVHAPAFTLHPKFEVVAIASPRNAAAVAAERKIPHAFDSLAELLRDVEVDVVSVASPPFDHRASVLAALAAGKHVLCEKPFAMSVAEAEEMVAAAERAGTACAIAHEFRYAPAPAALKELLDNGHMPRLREIEVTAFLNVLRSTARRPRSDWWYSGARGGGLGNAYMPHLVDLANWFAARAPTLSTGFSRTAVPERSDDAGTFENTAADGVFALLDYGDGLMARISTDATTSMNQTTLGLHAEDRTAVATGAGLTTMNLYMVEPDEQSELELAPSPYAKFTSIHGNVPAFLSLLDDFAQRIESGGGNAPTFTEALAVQRVLAAVGYGSAS
jgi:predicted dehydrogenase